MSFDNAMLFLRLMGHWAREALLWLGVTAAWTTWLWATVQTLIY